MQSVTVDGKRGKRECPFLSWFNNAAGCAQELRM